MKVIFQEHLQGMFGLNYNEWGTDSLLLVKSQGRCDLKENVFADDSRICTPVTTKLYKMENVTDPA